jgi:hypothetical protein
MAAARSDGSEQPIETRSLEDPLDPGLRSGELYLGLDRVVIHVMAEGMKAPHPAGSIGA